MKFIEKVLLAVDFVDQDNKHLIEAAKYISDIFNSHLVVLNVIPAKTDDESVLKYLKNYADEEMGKLSQKFEQAGLHFETRIVEGNPFEEILDTAEREDFNVILLGNGNAGSDTNQPGITVRKLIRKTSVPVWVIKEKATIDFKSILCPVDFSESSRRALTNAMMLASKMKSGLKIISVYEPMEVVSGRISADLDEYNEHALNDYKTKFNAFIKEYDFQDINYNTSVLMGKPEKEILKELKSGKHDLLLMGTTGRTGLSRMLIGSVTEKVVEDSPVSYITTKKKNILNPEFELKIAQLETLLKEADENMIEHNYFKAAELYEKCLNIDVFLLPAIRGAARAYKKAGKNEKAFRLERFEKEIVRRLWKTGIPEDK